MHRILAFLTCLLSPLPASALTVVTDTPVVHSLVLSVLGDRGDATLLLDPGSDPHSFQLRPSQARDLARADIVFWVGKELTPWLDRVLATVADDAVTVSLLDDESVNLRAVDEDPDAHQGDDHDHGDIDPHAWLDPENARAWVSRIAEELARLDPENAEFFRGNARDENTRIDKMSAELHAMLAPVGSRSLVTFHDAYGYFGAAFDVDFAGSIAMGDAASPGAGRLRELREAIATGTVACVFAEAQQSSDLITTLTQGTGVEVGSLDPSGTSLAPGPDLYRSMMQAMATEIRRCIDARP